MSADAVTPPSATESGWTTGDRIVLESALLVLCWALAALIFAVGGWFHWWLVVPVSLIVFLLIRRVVPRSDSGLDLWWWLAIVVALGTLIVNGANPGEHLLTGRDSGTYMATAGWLAEESTLVVDAEAGALEGVEGLEFVLPGFYEWIDGREGLEPQFMHAFPAMLGTLIDLGDISTSFWLNPALGAVFLLALFSLARRFVRPWAALLAVLVVATSLVFLYFARTPFTEVLMALFAVTGLVALGEAEERSNGRLAILAGALLGATVLARVDGVVLMIPATLYLLARSRNRSGSWIDRRSLWALLAVAVIGLAESLFVSPAYIIERLEFVAPPLLVVVALVVGNDLVGKHVAKAWRERILPNRRRILAGGIAVAALVLAFAWFVRPLVAEPSGPIGGDLSFVEEREGLNVEGRRYQAYSVHWITWYQGAAFVILGFVGAAAMVVESGHARLRAPSWLIPLSLVTFSALYFWRPAITPDHIWAMRRYLTVVIPLGALTSAVALDRFHTWASSRTTGNWVPAAGSAALVLALLVPPVVTTAPVWDVREFEGLADEVAVMCDDLGEDTNVLVVDNTLAQYLVQGFRSYCGLPAAWVGSPSEHELNRTRAQIEAAGGDVAIVALGHAGTRYLDGDYRRLELTLSYPPSTTRPFPVRVSMLP